MNRAYSLLIALFFIATGVQSQTQDTLQTRWGKVVAKPILPQYFEHNYPQATGFVRVDASGGIASNAILQKLISEDYWGESLKQTQVDALKKNNRAGFNAEADIIAYLPVFRDENPAVTHVSIGIRSTYLGGFILNQDVVKLIIEGNKKNQVVDFGNSPNMASSAHFSTIEIGQVWSRKNKGHIHIGLGIVSGHQYTGLNIRSGKLITDQSGEMIDAENADFSWALADPQLLSGLGVSASFRITSPVNRRTQYQSGFRDFGFVRWNKAQSIEPADGAASFEGFNVTGFWEEDYSFSAQDSINNNYLIIDDVNMIRLLPGLVYFNLQHHLSNSNQLEAKLSYRILPGYMPLVQAIYKVRNDSERLGLHAGLNLGGFGGIASNLGGKVMISPNMNLNANMIGVERFLMSDIGINQGVSVQWNYLF